MKRKKPIKILNQLFKYNTTIKLPQMAIIIMVHFPMISLQDRSSEKRAAIAGDTRGRTEANGRAAVAAADAEAREARRVLLSCRRSKKF